MRVAVACRGLDVAGLYDNSDTFTVYTIDRGIVTGCNSIPFQRTTEENRIDVLKSLEADTLICGAIDVTAATKYCHQSIEVIAGVEGSSIDAVTSWLNHTLSGYDSMCSCE